MSYDPRDDSLTIGRQRAHSGYCSLKRPTHPRATPRGFIYEHIHVVERALGRVLPAKAVVHHVNDDESDNAPRNLVACQNQAYHMLLHQRRRALEECGDANAVRCGFCGGYEHQDKMYRYPSKQLGFHKDCHTSWRRGRHG